MQLSTHFNSAEFACHCGCGQDTVDPKLIDTLELIRATLNQPIKILSGRRCKKHNTAVGGAKNSQHLLGKAADIQIDGISPHDLYYKIVRLHNTGQAHIGGLGLYKTFVHVDVRNSIARWDG